MQSVQQVGSKLEQTIFLASSSEESRQNEAYENNTQAIAEQLHQGFGYEQKGQEFTDLYGICHIARIHFRPENHKSKKYIKKISDCFEAYYFPSNYQVYAFRKILQQAGSSPVSEERLEGFAFRLMEGEFSFPRPIISVKKIFRKVSKISREKEKKSYEDFTNQQLQSHPNVCRQVASFSGGERFTETHFSVYERPDYILEKYIEYRSPQGENLKKIIDGILEGLFAFYNQKAYPPSILLQNVFLFLEDPYTIKDVRLIRMQDGTIMNVPIDAWQKFKGSIEMSSGIYSGFQKDKELSYDSWGLGVLLYKMYYRKELDWRASLLKIKTNLENLDILKEQLNCVIYQKNKTTAKEICDQFTNARAKQAMLVDEAIKEYEAYLEKTPKPEFFEENPSADQMMQYMIWHLLQREGIRWKMQEVKAFWNKHSGLLLQPQSK